MSGMIFISYRRGDDPGSTGRLFERLQVEGFSSDQIFMDIDSIAPGVDFIRELNMQVTKADVMLAVIGKGWIDARDATGARRLDNPDDFVRVEIEAALKQDKRVIPVLMQDAPMPGADELPAGLKALAKRNYIRLTHERFRLDTQALVKALRKALDEVASARVELARRDTEEIERRRQQEEAARRARMERQAEEEAARRAQVEEKARQQLEDARRAAIAALSPEQITKAEELANWDFIKQSTNTDDFRDHLARFPGGVCERMARHRLSTLVWSALGSERRKEALESFLKEYPDGPHAEEAKRELSLLQRPEADHAREESVQKAREAAEREKAAMGGPSGPKPESKLPGWGKVVLGLIALVFGGAALMLIEESSRQTVTRAPVPKPAPAVVVAPRCPAPSESAHFDLSLNAGFKPFRKSVTPGGPLNLSNCRADMTGWVSTGPDVGLRYETQGNRTLTIEVDSTIDTVLAIADPQGNWHYNDDGAAGSNNPRIIFPKAARGRYAIWVGKYNENSGSSNSTIIINDR